MKYDVNSKEYWENRFKEKDWDTNHGQEQTAFFADMFYSLCPEWIKEYLSNKNYKYLDAGCAEGDGTAFLNEHFSGTFEGIDFSEAAVSVAQSRFQDIKFMCMDLNDIHGEWDVVYISNVLEHFNNPFEILRKICSSTNRIVFMLVPFEENGILDEHVAKFDYTNIPLAIDDFSLISCEVGMDQGKHSEYPEQEVLLVYSKDLELNKIATISKSFKLIRDSIADKDYVNYKSKYIVEGEMRAIAEKKIDVLEQKVNTLNEELKNIKETNGEIYELKKEVATLRAENTRIEKERQKIQSVYDNLYSYSYHRDIKLNEIERSRGYKVYKKLFYYPMRIVFRVLRKIYHILKKLVKLDFTGVCEEIYYPIKCKATYLKGKMEKKRVLKDIETSITGKRVVVLPPTLDWNMELFQRPQQLAMAYSKKSDTVVIYLTANMKYDRVSCGKQVMDNLWLVNCAFCDQINEILKSAGSVVLSISWTKNKIFLDKIRHDYFVYEYIDEISIFDGYDEDMERDHVNMMKNADVTVCTATKLLNQAKGIAKNPILSPNAGDYQFFATARDAKISSLLVNKIEKYKVRLGYYGALAEWFDYNLVKEVATKHSDWLWILVGMDYDKTLGKSGILELDNVLYIPPQPYKLLPTFLRAFDIATIPFKLNEITLSTSPVKLFEYMAANKPILTSKMPECLKYKSVFTYSNADDFADYVNDILNKDSNDAYWNLLEEEAKENTWDARTDEILSEVVSVNK